MIEYTITKYVNGPGSEVASRVTCRDMGLAHGLLKEGEALGFHLELTTYSSEEEDHEKIHSKNLF